MAGIEHNFFIGDTEHEIKKIQTSSIQLIITSPPYWNAKDYNHDQQLGFNDNYNDYLKKLKKIIKQFDRILLPDGKIAINISNIYFKDEKEKRCSTINLVQDIWNIIDTVQDFSFMGTIYWKKPTSRNGAVLFGSYPYPSNFMISTALESIHVFRKKGKRKVLKDIKEKSRLTKDEFREYREPIWYLNGITNKKHPAVFPNELPNRLIKLYSFYGDTILDPFCGIGTTNIEAQKLYRNSIGIDIREDFVNIAIKNIKKNHKKIDDYV